MRLIGKWRIRILMKEVYGNPVSRVEEFLFECIESLHDNTVYPVKNLLRSIKSVIKWLPIIWNDRDWDEHFLLKILEFKFRNMSKYHKEYGHTTTSDKTAKELLIMAEYCARLDDKHKENGIFPTTKMKRFMDVDILDLNRTQVKMLKKHRRAQKEGFSKLFARKLDKWWD